MSQNIQQLIQSYHSSIKEIRTLGEVLSELVEATRSLASQSNALDLMKDCFEVFTLACNDSRNFKLVLQGLDGAKVCLEYEKQIQSSDMYSRMIMHHSIEHFLNQLGQLKVRDGIVSFFVFLIELYSDPNSFKSSDKITVLSLLDKIWSMKYGEHKNPKIRGGVYFFVYNLMQRFPLEFPFPSILPRWIACLNDPDPSIRDLASQALELSYKKCGSIVLQKIESDPKIRASQKKEILSRLDTIESEVAQTPTTQSQSNSPSTLNKTARKRKSFISDLSIQNEDTTPVIPVSSNTQVQQHFKTITKALHNKKDWKERLHGLQVLHGITLGGACNFDTFKTQIQQLKMSLEEQLQDLRSSIVREVCDCLAIISQQLRLEFSNIAAYFIESLEKLIVNTVQIMADSANICIREMITNCNLSRTIPKIIDLIKGTKHKVQRIRNTEYMLLMLQSYSHSSLHRYCDNLMDGISFAVVDGSPEVRKAGRRSFWEFNAHFPEEAQRLMMTFDLSVQKLLKNEEQDDYTLFQSTSSGRALSASNSPKSFQGSPSSKNLNHRASPSRSQLERRNSEGSSFFSSNSNQSSSSEKIPIRRGPESKRISTAPVNAKRSRLGQPDRVILNNRNTTSEPEICQPTTPPVRRRPTAPSSQKKSLVSTPQRTNRSTVANEKGYPIESLSSILKSTKSTDWNERVYMFTKLEEMCNSGRLVELQNYFSKVVRVLELGLNDIHFKVVSASLAAMQAIIPHVQENFKKHLEKTLLLIFSKLTDSKVSVRNLASAVLETIGESYTGDELFPILLKVCDSQNVKIQLGCLEYMHHILPQATMYYNQASHMKQCILKLNSLISTFKGSKTTSTCYKATLSLFIQLYKLNRVLFLEQILQLPKAWEYSARELLKDIIPNFEMDLAEVARLGRRHDSFSYSMNDSNLSTYPSDAQGSDQFYEEPLNVYHNNQAMMDTDPLEADGFNYEKYFAGQANNEPLNSIEDDSIHRHSEDVTNNLPSPNLHPPYDQLSSHIQEISPSNNYNYQHYSSPDEMEEEVASDIINHDKNELNTSALQGEWNENMSDEDNVDYHSIQPAKVPEEYLNTGHPPANRNLEELFSELIRRLSNSKGDIETLQYFEKIRRLAKEQDETAWTAYFPQILFLLLELLHAPTVKVREESLLLILLLLEHQTSQFEQFAELVLKRILEKLGDVREVRIVAEKTASTYAEHMSPQLILRIILPLISSDNDTILLGAIRMLSRIVSRIHKEELLEHIPRVLPALFEAFGHQNVDIRKSVVYCLVDIYIQLGDQFKPFLSNLNSSQLKLVTVYLRKRGSNPEG